jgi:16S rRNA (guanine966-N2)-methyltransferase
VLDLYAGSGSLGIEMLSRGAEWCDFVEHSPAAARVIRDNLRTTGFEDRAHVYVMPVARFLSMQEEALRRKQGESARLAPDWVDRAVQYDIILLDPPYADPTIHSTLEAVARWPLLAPDGLVVVGHATPVKLYEEYGEGRIRRVRHRTMGGSSFSIYEVVR